jgi:dynein heavy chain
MKKRHWDRISELTKHPIDIESDDLKLRNIMEGNLLKFKEEIEVIKMIAFLIRIKIKIIFFVFFTKGYLYISR